MCVVSLQVSDVKYRYVLILKSTAVGVILYISSIVCPVKSRCCSKLFFFVYETQGMRLCDCFMPTYDCQQPTRDPRVS